MAEALATDAMTHELLRTHAMNGAQRQADGAAIHVEHARTDYLITKNLMSFSISTGMRHLEESGGGRARETTAGPPPNR